MMQAPSQSHDPLVPELYRVSDVRQELADTVTLEIVPESGIRPGFLPGQFNMLYAFGVGEVAISICDETSNSRGFVHSVREFGAVSRALARMETGTSLGVRGPFGTAWPLEQAEGSDVVIVAGGIGLAPLRPAIETLLARRERYGMIAILVGCRSPDTILYRRELEEWRRRLDIDIEVTVDHAGTDWHGNVGVVTTLIDRVAFDPDDAMAFVCGPEVMMRFAASALQRAGLDTNRVYISMERNMKCAAGMCGRCQFGPSFVCKDGPVMCLDRVSQILAMREI